MKSAPIVLVPGWWLGAWAWDEVCGKLRDAGHEVTAITLPGLESADTDRSEVSAEDHVQAIVDAIRQQPSPVVLAVHSGAGYPGYAATDRAPELVAEIVYVDTGAGVGAMDAEFADAEKPLPSPEELAKNENLDGLTDEQLRRFRERAVPQPGGVLRQPIELTNDARLDVPSTVICTAYTADEYRDAIDNGYDFVAGLKDVRNVNFVELPTSHWPMWSRPDELADILGEIAERHPS